VRLVRNVLSRGADGRVRATPTEEIERIDCGILFRSVGYRGLALPELPYDEHRGVLPNERGRLIEPASGTPLAGLYTSGWIKRGPSGVIGTNKPDAFETVGAMLEDLAAGRHTAADRLPRSAVERLLLDRGVRFVTYPEWEKIDRLEVERGKTAGRPRVKITDRAQMIAALGGAQDR
jgi:ferredoxin--NADP+ reductase